MSSKKEGKSQAKAPVTEKGNAKSKGALPSILKGSPAPPRYKHGEVPPLPAFPITWTPIGVCVESIEENYSLIQVAELINAQTLPALSVSVVDAGEMVEEEMFFEESELGIILVAAKKDYLDKSKGSTNQDWMSPSLLAQSLLVRSCLDKDFEHRKEERRRTNALDVATKASEEARSVLEEAHEHLASAKEAIEKLIKDEQIRSNLEKESGKALSELLQPFHMENKASSTSSKLADKANAVLDQAKASASQKAEKANNNAQKNLKGKPLSKDDKSGLDDPVQDFKDRLQKMKDSILYSENNLQVAQSKVTLAAKHASTLKSSSQQPYVTARIYWCLGFGSTALFIASLAAEKKSIFRAIFNLTLRYQHAAATSDGRQETENGLKSVDRRTSSLSVLPFQKSQIPTLIADMRALVQVSGLNEPARKIAVVDIFYENVVESEIIPGEIKLNQSIKGNEGEQGQKTSETKKVKIGSPGERKGSSLLLNEEIAKSIAIGFQKLVPAVQTYDDLEDKLQCQNVQVALPTEDINMRYYHQLLSGVPPALTSVPVILHCILEQVACLDCFSSRANTVEVETQKESSRLAMQNAVDKLGQRTNALSITESMKQNLQAPYAQPLPVSLHGKERKIIYRRPSTISNQFRISDVEDIEEGERLIAVQELDRVGRLAAIAQQKEFETISIAEISKHVDVVKVERRMLELLPLPGVSKSARRFMAPSMDALRASNQKSLSIAQRYKKLTMFSSMALKYNESAKDDLRDMRKSHCDKEDLGKKLQSSKLIEPFERYHFVEEFPDVFMFDVYAKAKLVLPFEKVFHDKAEGCYLALLYAEEGEYIWEAHIPCQVPFGDFFSTSTMFEWPKRKLVYSLERSQSTIYERKWVHLENEEVVCCGLPSTNLSRDVPQTTLFKDGNVFMLRGEQTSKGFENFLTICIKDGLTICFYMKENGKISLQVTTTCGRTCELTPAGVVFMLPSNKVKPEYSDSFTNSSSTEGKSQVFKTTKESQAIEEVNGGETTVSGLAAQIRNHYIGDDEIQRSVLPSGTIVSYKRNGSLQLLLRNGNVSDYVVDPAGLAHWLTTNNKGLSTLKVVSQENISPSPEQKEHTGMNSGNKATVLIGEKITNQTKGKDMISTKEAQAKSAEGKKEKDKIVKDSKTSKKAEDPGRKSGSVKASNDQNNSDNNRKGDLGQIDQLNIISNQKASNEKEFMDVSSTWMPPADKLPFTVAPSKKIVQITDPDTGTSIVTREDLVVVINSPKESTCLVHHADGTQMFSQVMKDINMPSKLNISLLNSSSVIDAGKTCGRSSEGKKCNDAPMWHSKKEGLPDVYGTKEGNIRVRFSTPGGDHWAEWSKSSGNLSFQLPCGNLFHTRSNTTIFEPSDKACFGSPSESHGCTNAGLTLLALKDWESKHFHLGEEQDCKQKAMNTSGKYIFNLAQGTLLHTDKDGNGYMMQKGSIIDFIEEGRVVSLNSFKKDNALVNLSRGGENGSPVSSPISFDAMTSQIKSAMLFSRGPSPRLFVIYEGGHGFEFLNEKTFKDFVNLKKLNKTWIQTSQMIKNCDEDIRSHLFVSLDDCLGFHVRKGKQATPFFASKLSNSAILLEDSLNRKFHEESKNNPANLGCSQLDMALPNLPRVILPSNISTLQNRKEAALILYRQIYEYSATFEEQTAQVEMEEEACARWKDSKYMHNRCRKPSESRYEKDGHESIVKCITENYQRAKACYEESKQAALDFIKSLKEVETQERENALVQEYEEKEKLTTEVLKHVVAKKQVLCIHKAANQLQSEGPFRLNPNFNLFYFRCEEGIRALLPDFQNDTSKMLQSKPCHLDGDVPLTLRMKKDLENGVQLVMEELLTNLEVDTTMQTCNQVLSSGHMFNEKLESSSTSLPFICREAVWHPNIHSFEKQLLRTSSMELLNKRRPLLNKPQFRVIPETIFFKQVPVGSTAIQAVTLFNFNHDLSRFRVESNMDCLKFYYQHGMVAPGMNRVLKVHFVAPEVGKFVGKVEIKTQSDNLSILVLAEVINP